MDSTQLAQLIGTVIGALLVGAACGMAPLILGLKKRRPVIAWIGFASCLMAGLVLGLLLAVPMAIGFSIFLAVISPEPQAYVTQNAASVIGLPPFPAGPIYITIHGKQEGPYSRDQLQALWNAGTLHPGSFYWQDGMPEWKPVRELIENQG